MRMIASMNNIVQVKALIDSSLDVMSYHQHALSCINLLNKVARSNNLQETHISHVSGEFEDEECWCVQLDWEHNREHIGDIGLGTDTAVLNIEEACPHDNYYRLLSLGRYTIRAAISEQ